MKYVKDAHQHKIEVRPPHVSYSGFQVFRSWRDYLFFARRDQRTSGRRQSKRSFKPARNCCRTKKFESLEQFFESVDLKKVNKEDESRR